MLADRKEKLDSVVQLKIEDQLLISRITGRLIHPGSGRTYHREFQYVSAPNINFWQTLDLIPSDTSPPKKSMTDDVTGEALIQRSDDNVETLRKRLLAFHSQTGPVVEYYKSKGLWRGIDAAQSPAVVWDNLSKVFTKP